MQRRWWVFAVISLAFFFATGATFTSLAVVLFSMADTLHWSLTDAGLSFSLMALACGITSPLPAFAMKRIGPCATVTGGALLLAVGFHLASLAQALVPFFVASALLGAGFTLIAPVPGIWLLPAWFPRRAPRLIGFYFMLGALGGVIGPPLVERSVQWGASWRAHWALMEQASLGLAVLCLLAIRQAPAAADIHPGVEGDTGERDTHTPLPVVQESLATALRSQRFVLVALAMLVIQTGLTIVHGMLVAHVTHLGGSRPFAAWTMSLIAVAETIGKGLAGPLAERIHPHPLLIAGLLAQVLAFLLLGIGPRPVFAMVFAVLYGGGWGVGWIGANILLLRYYGREAAPRMVGAAVAITTLAVVGPVIAGMVADRRGSLAMVFLALGGLLATTAALLAWHRPRPTRQQRTAAPAAERSASSAHHAKLTPTPECLAIPARPSA